jgi:hypothetical protein
MFILIYKSNNQSQQNQMQTITWKDKINQWKNEPQQYPLTMNDRFFYETSACDKNMNNIYEENFIPSTELNKIIGQDYTPFSQHILNTNNKDAVSFFNISGDTILVVPIPRKNKFYTTIKEFIDFASESQQIGFWKLVAEQIESCFLTSDIKKLYISTHGLGVSYFHLRICTKPKYYHTEKFINPRYSTALNQQQRNYSYIMYWKNLDWSSKDPIYVYDIKNKTEEKHNQGSVLHKFPPPCMLGCEPATPPPFSMWGTPFGHFSQYNIKMVGTKDEYEKYKI